MISEKTIEERSVNTHISLQSRLQSVLEEVKMMQFEIGIVLTIICATWYTQAAVDCNAMGRGRFADPDDSSCRNYSMCLYVTTPLCQYKAYEYTCPVNTIFDPSMSICTAVTNYLCQPREPTCTEEGYAPNLASYDCSSYAICISSGNGFEAIIEDCPAGTLYNPDTTDCEYEYQCKQQSSCSAAGLVANLSDKTCQTYSFCQQLTDGNYVSYNFKCPGIWKFHPVYKVCTANYICPTVSRQF